LMDADTSLARFRSSAHVKRIWPATMVEPSAEFFRLRGWIHDLWVKEERRVSEVPVGSLESIYLLLTESDLETAVLWSLGTGYRDQLVVDRVITEGQANEWVLEKLGHRFLAERDYQKAGEAYDKALADMPQDSSQYQTAIVRRAFVFCMMDQAKLAGELLQSQLGSQQLANELRSDVEFLQSKFGLPALGQQQVMQVAVQ